MQKEQTFKEIDLVEYWRIVVRRKWIAISFMGMLLLFTGIFSFLASPLYQATTTLLIEEESAKILSFDQTFGNQSQVFQDLRSYNTQLKLLKSKSLAERVARKLDLLTR